MAKKLVVSQPTSVGEPGNEPASPLLLLSSDETSWDGLVVRAYREPMEIEQWAAPLVSTLTLGLVLSGTMELEQRDVNGPWKGQHLRQGDLFLRPAGRAPYELRWQVLSSQPVKTLLLHLHADLVSRTAEEMAGSDTGRLTLEERVGFQDPLLRQIGLTLWREIERQAPAGTLYLQAAAQLLAVHLLRQDTAAAEKSKASTALLTRRQMQRVTDFIQAHLDQDLSLELLAQQTGLSPYHFARVFRQTTGESPHQFVLHRRVERAKQLLRETDAPLAQVAQESGFASQSHLTHVFKRHLGLTPRASRHQLAALADAGYHAVAPDQRGYGQTDRPADAEGYTQLHLVGDVVGLIDALGEETACVAGHDWGAIIAWSAALLRPDRVKAVMALSVPYTPRGSVSSLAAGRATFGDGFYHNYFQQPGLAEAEFERDTRTTLRKFLYGASGDVPQDKRLALVIPQGRGMLDHAIDPDVLPAWLTQADIDFYATAFERTGFTGGLNWYRMIERSWELMAPWHEAEVVQPALFLAGDRDTVATSSRGQQQLATMRRFVPNLKATVLLPGAGHWLQQERPTEVTTAMLQFIRNL